MEQGCGEIPPRTLERAREPSRKHRLRCASNSLRENKCDSGREKRQRQKEWLPGKAKERKPGSSPDKEIPLRQRHELLERGGGGWINRLKRGRAPNALIYQRARMQDVNEMIGVDSARPGNVASHVVALRPFLFEKCLCLSITPLLSV